MIPRILCACLLCFALTAQAQTYEECASNPQMPNLQKTEEFILIAEGKYGDEYSYAEASRGSATMFYDCYYWLRKGEILVVTDFCDEYQESSSNWRSSYIWNLLSKEDGSLLFDRSDLSIVVDDKCKFVRAESDRAFLVTSELHFLSSDLQGLSDPETHILSVDNVPDSCIYSFCVQKIGLFKSFELRPIDRSAYSDMNDWVRKKRFSSSTSSAFIGWSLINEIECVATDTYGQEVILMCPTYSWSFDRDRGMAIYTPYFTPRLSKTKWESGTPIECSIAAGTGANKSLRLWAGNDDETPSSLSSPDAPSASPEYLDLSGRTIGGCPTTPGVYIERRGAETRKVVVR